MKQRPEDAHRPVLAAVRAIVLSVLVGAAAMIATSSVPGAHAMTLDRPGTEVRTTAGNRPCLTGYWKWNKRQQKWIWVWTPCPSTPGTVIS